MIRMRLTWIMWTMEMRSKVKAWLVKCFRRNSFRTEEGDCISSHNKSNEFFNLTQFVNKFFGSSSCPLLPFSFQCQQFIVFCSWHSVKRTLYIQRPWQPFVFSLLVGDSCRKVRWVHTSRGAWRIYQIDNSARKIKSRVFCFE